MDKLLDINPLEVVFVIAIISLLLILLNKMFFKPISGVIEERKMKVKADSDILQNILDQINDKTVQIENELKKAKRNAGKLREDLIKEGESVKEKIIEESRIKTKKMMSDKVVELESLIADTEKKLSNEIDLFSDKIKEKFL